MPAVVSTRGTIPLTPFLEGRGNSKKCWGTPPDPCQRGCTPSGLPAFKCWGTSSMPPASGVAPLWTPCLRGLRLNRGVHHPPNPLPGRKGEVIEKSFMEAHPPDRLPVGLHPSGLPAFKCWGTSSMPPASGVAPSGLPACHPGVSASPQGVSRGTAPVGRRAGVSASPQGASRGDRPLWQEVWRVSLQSFNNLPPSYQEGG